MDKKYAESFLELIQSNTHIVIVQADNPDADSLGSALALEAILDQLHKKVSLYCGVEIPSYLKYMQAWSRVENTLPTSYDCLIVVDASTETLLEKIKNDANYSATKTAIVLDHHETVQQNIAATLTINQPELSSTGELLYTLCDSLGLSVGKEAAEYLMSAILGDTQGLSNSLAQPGTYRVVANLLEEGVDRAKLEEQRKRFSKMTEDIFRYKARLIERTELFAQDTIAIVSIPQTEITTFSPLYNPVALIQPDMLQIENVKLAVVFKVYDDKKITAAIRANYGSGVAGVLAEYFGGGGHDYASGFKITDGRPFNEVKSECIARATELLQNN